MTNRPPQRDDTGQKLPDGPDASVVPDVPVDPEFPATGRRVLISGSSRGLGRALAQAFAQSGDRVAVHCATRREDAEETLRSLPPVSGAPGAHGGPGAHVAPGGPEAGHTLLTADISDPRQAERLVRETVRELGGLDVLVNNAAVNTPHPPATTPYEEWVAAWERHTAVNLLGTAHLSHQAAQQMIAQGGGGRIVNIGSRGAFRGEPDHPAYAATKAAVHALGQSLAVSLAPHGIAVASVAPGFIETERVAHRLEGEAGEAIRGQSPFGRVARPEEIAAAVHWLASPAAQWSSGAVLDLNGASYLRT